MTARITPSLVGKSCQNPGHGNRPAVTYITRRGHGGRVITIYLCRTCAATKPKAER